MSYPQHQDVRSQYGPEQTAHSHAVDFRQVFLSFSELSSDMAYSARGTSSSSYSNQMRRERFDHISFNGSAPVQYGSPFHFKLSASHVHERQFKAECHEGSKSDAVAYEEPYRQQGCAGQENCNKQSYNYTVQSSFHEQVDYETRVYHDENEKHNKSDCNGYREANQSEEPPNQYASGCGFYYEDREPSQYAQNYDVHEDRKPDQYAGGYGFHEDGDPAQDLSGCDFYQDGETDHSFDDYEHEDHY